MNPERDGVDFQISTLRDGEISSAEGQVRNADLRCGQVTSSDQKSADPNPRRFPFLLARFPGRLVRQLPGAVRTPFQTNGDAGDIDLVDRDLVAQKIAEGIAEPDPLHPCRDLARRAAELEVPDLGRSQKISANRTDREASTRVGVDPLQRTVHRPARPAEVEP